MENGTQQFSAHPHTPLTSTQIPQSTAEELRYLDSGTKPQRGENEKKRKTLSIWGICSKNLNDFAQWECGKMTGLYRRLKELKVNEGEASTVDKSVTWTSLTQRTTINDYCNRRERSPKAVWD